MWELHSSVALLATYGHPTLSPSKTLLAEMVRQDPSVLYVVSDCALTNEQEAEIREAFELDKDDEDATEETHLTQGYEQHSAQGLNLSTTTPNHLDLRSTSTSRASSLILSRPLQPAERALFSVTVSSFWQSTTLNTTVGRQPWKGQGIEARTRSPVCCWISS